jgi:beta-phosphoglucomutase
MNDRRAVIFDMDGVLVLSGPAHWVAWRDVAAANGLQLSREQFHTLHGLVNEDICRRLWGDAVTPEFTAAVVMAKEAAFRRAIETDLPLAGGCRELLVALQRRHVGIALGSAAPAANVDLVLDAGGIRDFFGAVVTAEMVTRGKPAPDIFLLAADLLGMAPDRCIVVEDAVAGVCAARAAGMDVVGVASNVDAARLLAAGARLVAPELRRLALADLLPV